MSALWDAGRHEEMKRFPLTLPQVGSTYPFKIDGTITLRTIESVDLGQGLMVLTSPDHPPRPTHINNVVEFVRPNDAAAWLPVLREHYTMSDEGRAALIAEANASPIDTELMEAVDAWHAAGENTDDLSHDLYATIGDPVPSLVWPRQESEQSPTKSMTEQDLSQAIISVVSESQSPLSNLDMVRAKVQEKLSASISRSVVDRQVWRLLDESSLELNAKRQIVLRKHAARLLTPLS